MDTIENTFEIISRREEITTISPFWISDNSVNECYECQILFSLFNRKHHCRICGRIFCYKCCVYSDIFNDHIQIKSMSSFNTQSSQQQRVCKKCNNESNNIHHNRGILTLLSHLDITTINNIRFLNKSFNESSKIYFLLLHRIPYSNSLSQLQNTILKSNYEIITQHNNLLTLYCTIFSSHKLSLTCYNTVKCSSLGCKNDCKPYINEYQLVNILINEVSMNSNIDFIIETFNQIPRHRFELFLFHLITCSKKDKTNQIIDFIISKCLTESHICSLTLWYLNYLHNYHSIYEKYYLKFIKSLENNQKLPLMVTSIRIMILLTKHQDKLFESKLNNYKDYINITDRIQTKKYYLEYIFDCSQDVSEVDISKFEIKDSNSAPLIISLKLNNDVTQKIMYKYECIIQDVIICNLIKIIDNILNDELGIDFGIVKYRVLPFNTSSGFVEIVPNCETIYNIKYRKNLSVLNYILENNPECKISDVKSRFLKSAAVYTIITYLLGIGDRHLDNIMITNTGYLFHIDYGFLLGQDPKILTPSMRITSDIVDALGGEHSIGYEEFKLLCIRIYRCLRCYSTMFYSMLSILNSKYIDKYDDVVIKKHINERFCPYESDYNSEKKLLFEIDSSYRTYTSVVIIDLVHRQSKEYLNFK
jgi:hypothetical protein